MVEPTSDLEVRSAFRPRVGNDKAEAKCVIRSLVRVGAEDT